MQIFRRRYIYNSQNPIFQNNNVKTYNCMDTETKNNRLLLLHHLITPVQVLSQKGILQPIQSPLGSQPFSVYPLINCCSQIGKLNQNDAMYILKCLVQIKNKLKKPLYYAISPDGIVGSQIQGLLPERSPDLFNIALELLDLPPSLVEVEKSVVSKQGYNICRAIRDNQIDTTYFSSYSWKDTKKQSNYKENDQNFWIFKAKRKQEGPFNQQYGLAWHPKFGICRVKTIDLNKDSFQEELQLNFKRKVQFYQQNTSKNIELLQIHKVQKDNKSMKIFTSTANQGNLSDYIKIKTELNQKLTQSNTLSLLQNFIKMMIQISKSQLKGHMFMHIKNVYVHNNRITLGQPMFITDKIQKKLRDLKKNIDYYAPQVKENIILPQKLFSLNQQKIDIWSFGFLLHKIFTGEVPIFDQNKNPTIQNKNISYEMANLIKKCLNLDPSLRPRWQQINLRALQKQRQVRIQDVKQQIVSRKQSQQIHLDSPSIRSKKIRSVATKQLKQMISIKQAQHQTLIIKQEQAKIPEQQQQFDINNEQKIQFILPAQISSKLKRIKLTVKIIIIMIMYIIVFFGPFIKNTFNMLVLKGQLQKTPLNLIDYSGTVLSSITILTAQSKFFLFNDISFSDIQNKYHCINDRFDPINNPNYSLYNYITSGNFQALIYTGWFTAIVICCIKSLSIWKGGISNRPRKTTKRYWIVYGFHQLSMASLLFAHFFIYQFFYFSSISPCFSIQSYEGIEPFFDSSLYLFLSNESGYMMKVFSSLCVLGILLTISGCFYAWVPKFDLKHFSTVPSIICRLIPYLLMFLICRIGVFKIFSPTALNDTTQIIPSIIANSSKGFFGIIPEVFVIICVSIEVLLQLLLYWCEQKASENDSLSKMFNIHHKKFLDRNDSMTLMRSATLSRNNSDNMKIYQKYGHVHEMSIDQSKEHLGYQY